MQQRRWPELPPTEDAAATTAALRLLRAKIATLPGMPAAFTIPVIGGDPIPPGLRAVIATLTDLGASALLEQAGLSAAETEAQVRDRVLYYLDTVIELVTQQALARPGHALFAGFTALVAGTLAMSDLRTEQGRARYRR